MMTLTISSRGFCPVERLLMRTLIFTQSLLYPRSENKWIIKTITLMCLHHLFQCQYQGLHISDFEMEQMQHFHSGHICFHLSPNQPYNTVPTHSGGATAPNFRSAGSKIWIEKGKKYYMNTKSSCQRVQRINNQLYKGTGHMLLCFRSLKKLKPKENRHFRM